MRVQILLFAALRERAGTERLTLELPDGSTVADALEQLRWLTGGGAVVMAVNREYASPDSGLAADDELALIPPVSGGEQQPEVHVRISAQPLDPARVSALVSDPRAGALVTFTGVTREVPSLEYEAYVEMAELKLREILSAAISRHGLCRAAAEHRIGTVALSQPSVVVAVSAPHREQAFAGGREIIDELKAQAPIWKREQGEWVAGNRPDTPLG